MRFGRRKKKTGRVAETGKRSSQPNKGSREKPIPGEVGEAAEGQRAKAGYRHCPGLKPWRGWSRLVCPRRGCGALPRPQEANPAYQKAPGPPPKSNFAVRKGKIDGAVVPPDKPRP